MAANVNILRHKNSFRNYSAAIKKEIDRLVFYNLFSLFPVRISQSHSTRESSEKKNDWNRKQN